MVSYALYLKYFRIFHLDVQEKNLIIFINVLDSFVQNVLNVYS
jgi:hypothetical protein